MYSKFKYETIPLKDILLDNRNPRIVTQKRLTTQDEILEYLFEHEDLGDFVKKIATEGKNFGAERPYVVKDGSKYVVIEGNTRIAAYKLLTGLVVAPKGFESFVPSVSKETQEFLSNVDCSIAPDRDALLSIMADAHFGLGDKSKWGYLGSRKAVYDEWKAGKSIPQLSKAFRRTKGQIRDLIIEYQLYLKTLGLKWTKKEKERLEDPAVEFNPPVRFLQTAGHKEKVGIQYDTASLNVLFENPEARKKFKHLVSKLVINPRKGLGATASYDDVFVDFGEANSEKSKGGKTKGGDDDPGGKGNPDGGKPPPKLKPTSLFSYPVSMENGLVVQLMKEAKDINCKKFPASGTFLLRNIVESILKHIIDDQKANKTKKSLDLEGCISLCLSNAVFLTKEEKKILKQFRDKYLDYLNLGAHGNVIPNFDAVMAARDCIDQFVKRNV